MFHSIANADIPRHTRAMDYACETLSLSAIITYLFCYHRVFADPLNRNDPEDCCGRPPHLKNPYCNEILIPEDDYFYRLFNVQCMNFVRAFPAVRPGCRLGSRVPFNLLTGVLDGNTVYGITETFAR